MIPLDSIEIQSRLIVRNFLERSQQSIGEFQESLQELNSTDIDYERLARLAHQLKGSAGTFGLQEFAQIAILLESSARAHASRAEIRGELSHLWTLASQNRTESPLIPTLEHERVTPGTLRIVCIEDDEVIAQMLQLVLSSAGYTVDRVADGNAGWARLCESPAPDLTLLDLSQPGLSNLEILSRRDSNESVRRIPALVLSNRFSQQANLVTSLGARTYAMTKPFDTHQLLLRIREILKQGLQTS